MALAGISTSKCTIGTRINAGINVNLGTSESCPIHGTTQELTDREITALIRGEFSIKPLNSDGNPLTNNSEAYIRWIN